MAKKKPADKPDEGPRFEDVLGRLEEIAHELEEGQPGLNEAMARYEEGVKLLRKAHGLLEHAERRIEVLSGVDAEGNPVAKPFDAEATETREDRSRARDGESNTPKKKVARRKGSSEAEEADDVDSPGSLF